mmetsp:Transcript_12346/g.40582  ORF Transcript_12346/g.40582 Transcript_12346/m.40582 type:complete len:210 (-) Transcript_12346:1078-1707(-)
MRPSSPNVNTADSGAAVKAWSDAGAGGRFIPGANSFAVCVPLAVNVTRTAPVLSSASPSISRESTESLRSGADVRSATKRLFARIHVRAGALAGTSSNESTSTYAESSGAESEQKVRLSARRTMYSREMCGIGSGAPTMWNRPTSPASPSVFPTLSSQTLLAVTDTSLPSVSKRNTASSIGNSTTVPVEGTVGSGSPSSRRPVCFPVSW